MFTLLGIAVTVSKIFYYFIYIFPIGMIVYLICRRPFQSRWVRAAYFINNICIILFLIYVKLL